MTITLPENFGRTDDDGTAITTQTYDMRSVIEAIMELNRRTAFMGSNCSFLKAMEKHQTRAEQYDENNEPTATDNPDQFACNRDADGLPAARNGVYEVPSDNDGTVITVDSINKLRQDITELNGALNAAKATITELSHSYASLYEATRIRRFEFTVDWEPYIYDLENNIISATDIDGLQPSALLLAKGYYADSSNNASNPVGFDVNEFLRILETCMFLNMHMSIPYRSFVNTDGTTATLDPIDRYGVAVNQNVTSKAVRFIFGTSSVQHARLYPDITVSYKESRKPQIAVYAADRLPKDYAYDDRTTTVNIYSPAANKVVSVTRHDITKTAAVNTLCSAKGPNGLAGHTNCMITLYYVTTPTA